ncbi:MAG: DsbE family thiol:disulfide interchange protein [Woeseiaceae bacterium]|nr:DsbE family thiol:disulfide interchange protein [Woeseiaceae bacterium]
MWRYLLPVLAFAALIPVFIFGLDRDPSELPSPFIGKPAPEFTLPQLKDPSMTVGSSDYAGKTALVNVWATWCVGCRQEHGYLLELSAAKDIPLYGINWRDDRNEALNWLAQLGDPYVASGYDSDGRVGIDWGVYGAPETFLIGPDGTVLHKHLGPLNESIWQRDFAPKLAAVEEHE